ncbi:MAG: pectic acid lyase, partial [Pirellulaceae bacterium]|nr:pectic acid lyase [Pirellulaceae bacterium]
DFDESLRGKLAYRVDGRPGKKARNYSSFDDDQTQSALRFLMKVDRALKFEDKPIHEAVQLGLSAVVRNQFPNGAWSQVFAVPDQPKSAATRGTYPDTWSRQYPGGDYWFFYTLNDQALVRVMQTMWLAGQVYESAEYRQSALKAAKFLIDAQMPDPQPAWAQQYNYDMQPIWARKFEPPAISGGESQVVIDALMDMTVLTGDKQYLAPIPKALAYLKTCTLPDGKLARFYELKTNRPLYFTKEYVLTYDDSDVPTHYGFKVESQLDKLSQRYAQLKDLDTQALQQLAQKEQRQETQHSPSASSIAKIIAAMDERGAWVEPGRLKYVKQAPADRPMLRSETFIKNLEQLSRYIGHHRN